VRLKFLIAINCD